MAFSLTVQDILYAAALALVFTWLINVLSKVFKVVVTRSTEFGFNPNQIEAVTQKCYHMFPTESVKFNGSEFKRGMQVKVVTNRNKIFEGRFIGVNNENMACFITPQTVVAQELDKIEEIRSIES